MVRAMIGWFLRVRTTLRIEKEKDSILARRRIETCSIALASISRRKSLFLEYDEENIRK